eukprot:5067295-Pleurochrysis_carterae.AAC.1
MRKQKLYFAGNVSSQKESHKLLMSWREFIVQARPTFCSFYSSKACNIHIIAWLTRNLQHCEPSCRHAHLKALKSTSPGTIAYTSKRTQNGCEKGAQTAEGYVADCVCQPEGESLIAKCAPELSTFLPIRF